MKRDFDLIRDILLFAQKEENKNSNVEIEGFSQDEIRGHLKLMHDKNLLSVEYTKHGDFINEIKWDGYEFIKGTKDNKTWTKIKNVFIEKGIGLSIDGVIAWVTKSNSDS